MAKQILLVDDDPIFNFLAENIISSLKIACTVKSVLNGKEALNKLEDPDADFFPEIILLDINMPIMDGFQFLECFQQLDPSVKEKISIAMVTSSEDPKDIQKARGYGVMHYLNKPIREHEVKRVLEAG